MYPMDKQLEKAVTTIETTVGELVEIVTQIALESGNNEDESYELASRTLESILYRNEIEIDDLSIN